MKVKTIAGGGLATMLVLGTSLGAAAQQELGGFTWETLGPVTETTGTEVIQIANLPDGRIVLLGIECEPDHPCSPGEDATMMTWTSDDGGATWTETRADHPWLGDVVVHGDRLLTVDDDRKIMGSADGLEWEVLADLGSTVQDLFGIVATPAGLVVPGTELKPAEGWGEVLAPHPTLWLSQAGDEWQAAEFSGPLFDPDEDGHIGFAGGVARSEDGSWLVLGSGIEFPEPGSWREFAIAWHGSPETGWSQHELPEEVMYGVLLGSTPEGFIAGVQEQVDQNGLGATGLWLTTDGSDWELVADTQGPPEPVVRAAQTGDTIVGFQTAVSFEDPNGPPTMTDGSPTYATTDGRDWSDGELLQGINVTAVAAEPDGSVLVAGNATPCRDEPPECIVFWVSDTEKPIVMRGTPN